ncbi:hypothetical protein IWW36_002605 [Coemansia brasiliensis]|uniref:Uncharacterized protein n=1 Tax=Coemansia brasiliensis TaxID=2650707 RepID=A0A9W8IBN7_9FUNG|nr:hypothetical protein IWW36_002605 [Coemansia brasiliensis]
MLFATNKSQYKVDGKVILLTGALGAIGRQLAQRLAEKGARIALVDIMSDPDGQKFSDELNSGFGNPVSAYLKANLQDPKEIEHMLHWADSRFGKVDVLVNNAGIASPNMLYEGENFERISLILQVNLQAPIEAMRLFAAYITNKQMQGVVVNMASMGGMMPNRGGEVYGAAKAGLIHLTKASKSLAPQIRVSAIAPYYVNTPMVRNNPKLQNNNTVYPSLMLSVDQVCQATVRCIEDTNSAGKTYALIGTWTYAPMWLFGFAALHIKLLAAWSLITVAIRRLFGMQKQE